MQKIDTGDTAWLLVSSALVLLMTPALALFYGGMVRRKNVLSTLMHSMAAIPILSVAWALFGYSLAFGPTRHGLIGSFAYAGLSGLFAEVHGTVPALAFVAFQMMFAVITPALISGAFAERMKFSAYVAFILLWSTLVYDPVAHWVWATAGGCSSSARSTSPAAPWCIDRGHLGARLRAGDRQARRLSAPPAMPAAQSDA